MSRCCSCSFLWGDQTSQSVRRSILDALDHKTELQIEVYFHKKNGSTFLCLLDIVPIKNDKSQVVLFLVSHKELTYDSKMDRQEHENSKKESKNQFQRLFTQLTSQSTIPFGSFLTAGLATTITPATLGTGGFSNNKLLEYIHERNSSFKPANYGLSHLTLNSNRLDTASQSNLLQCEAGQSSFANDVRKKALVDSPSDTVITHGKVSSIEMDDYSNDSKNNFSSVSQRRRSRAVLYQLSGRYDQKPKRRGLFHRFQRISDKEAVPDYKVQNVKASRFIVLHYGLRKIVWDWIILLCTFYIAFVVPYDAAFTRYAANSKAFMICDILVEICLITDVILNFATTFVSKSGQVVYKLSTIAKNYLKGWFFIDLIAAIPFDFILAINSRTELGSQVRLFKLARLLRLVRLFQKIERYSQYSIFVLSLLMCMFFLIAHWFACGWYWLGYNEGAPGEAPKYNWLNELAVRMRSEMYPNRTHNLPKWAIYVSSLYFTTSSLTSVGFGNVSPNTVNEKIFSIVTMLIGALMHAAVFGNVTTLIQRMYARRSAYQTRNQDLKDFTRAHHIPKILKQRMLEFFQAMWAINRGIDKEAIMNSFPENLRGEIALHLNREILSLNVFKSASPGCRKCLAQLITTRFATPGEYIINKGDIIRYIFFVCSGSLEILNEEGAVVGLLGKCDLFGCDIDPSISISFSAYDVKSLTYCELQCLPMNQSFRTTMHQYPNFLTEFISTLQDELSFNIREGYEATFIGESLPAVTINSNQSDRSIRVTGLTVPSSIVSSRARADSTEVIVEDVTSKVSLPFTDTPVEAKTDILSNSSNNNNQRNAVIREEQMSKTDDSQLNESRIQQPTASDCTGSCDPTHPTSKPDQPSDTLLLIFRELSQLRIDVNRLADELHTFCGQQSLERKSKKSDQDLTYRPRTLTNPVRSRIRRSNSFDSFLPRDQNSHVVEVASASLETSSKVKRPNLPRASSSQQWQLYDQDDNRGMKPSDDEHSNRRSTSNLRVTFQLPSSNESRTETTDSPCKRFTFLPYKKSKSIQKSLANTDAS